MLIEEVALEKKFIELFKSEGITELYPPQQLLVESGILNGLENLVLSTPTASGKTIAAELVIAKVLERKKRAVFVVPLRSLAYEKFQEFQKYHKLGYKVRLEMGDLDSSKYARRVEFDILVTTAEKCDSILRSRPEWFKEIGILVVDEVHLLNSDRGPVYEILISKFRRIFADIQVLALSATIGNADEIAEWLDCKLVTSDWRPVVLHEKVEVGEEKYEKLKELVDEAVTGGGQVLVFVNSRRSAESVSEKLGKDLSLAGQKKHELDILGDEAENVLPNPTTQCHRLGRCIRNATAFHHAGLVNEQRILVENNFKNGIIKVITATPTLAAGVNLPARTVIVRDLTRFDEGEMGYISVMEYKQMAGRAGRPKYDTEGNAIMVAASESEKEFLTERFINGIVEPVTSRLGIEPVLRFHMLAAIASDFTRTREALQDFFRSTFFGFQYGLTGFESLMDRILTDLIEWGFIEEQGRFLKPTKLGARVSELYIDPRTAYTYITLLKNAEEENKFHTLGLLEMLCDSAELQLLRVKRSEEPILWEQAFKVSEEFYRDIGGFDIDVNFLERFKTARLFTAWINENSEDDILEAFNTAPGILNQKVQVAEWLAYSAGELSGILGMKKSQKEMRRLEMRIKYGITEELIPLVSIKGIGRARARKLWTAGLKKPSEIRDAPIEKLSALIGEKTAAKVKAELTGKADD
jgi:helicase